MNSRNEAKRQLIDDALAELHATIARLTAENEVNRNEREIVCANYDALKAELRKAKELLQEFCERVERGEVRSKSTYAKFMAFLK